MPHVHEKIDFTSEVFIVHKNKVLLRKHDKYNLWLGVGGHIELDEDPVQAAIREVKEEVGLDVKIYTSNPEILSKKEGYLELIPPEFLNRHRINTTHEHITFVYFAISKTEELNLSETEKSESCKWFNFEELNSDEISDDVRMYAKAALKKAGS